MTFSTATVRHQPRTFEQVIAPLMQDAIALNESLLEPDNHNRANANVWLQWNNNKAKTPTRWTITEPVRAAVARAAQEAQMTESEVVEEVLSDWAGLD